MRLKGGDPFVFGRGGEEAEACIAAGVPFEVVPGITSAIAAAAYAGIPVTHRGVSTSFTVVTGHEDPTKGGSDTDWDALARAGGTLVILMGAGRHRRDREGADRGRPRREHAGRRGALRHAPRPAHDAGDARDDRGGRASSRRARSSSATSPRSTSRWFERRPLFGRTVVVTRAREQASELRARLAALGATVLETARDPDRADRLRRFPTSRASAGSCSRRRTASTRSSTAGSRPPGSTPARSRRVRIAAIGPGTAAALARRGLRADLVPERFVAESLLDAFPPGTGRVLLARAEVARDVLPEGLAAKGYEVEVLAGVPHRARRRPIPTTLARVRAGRGRRDHVHVVVDGRQLLRRGRRAAARPATARGLDRSGHERRRRAAAACASTPRPIRTRSTAWSRPWSASLGQ